jgi:CRP/FNR family cyclic AMP-dependent transcriptional regulator
VAFLRELIEQGRQMASKRTLGFSSTVFPKKFRAGMTVRNYRDNEIVFSQGETADAVFYIQSGTVKLTVVATRRKKAIVAVLLQGSFFGEGCLGGQSLRIYTARSIGQSNITRLRKESMVRTLKRATVCNAVCGISSFPRYSSRGKLGRSIL